jgi:cell division protein FtsZ
MLIAVSNNKLLQIAPPEAPTTQAFAKGDVLRSCVIGIAEIILRTGLINVDFADVQAVMKDAGAALLGLGREIGPNRAMDTDSGRHVRPTAGLSHCTGPTSHVPVA